jgi:protease II
VASRKDHLVKQAKASTSQDVAPSAILLTTGFNDGRTAPYSSFKFAALLQASAAPGNPILLTINSFGHGIGSSLDQQVEDITDVLSFFAYEFSDERTVCVVRSGYQGDRRLQ